MGVTAATVMRIERGRHDVSRRTLKKLADAFGGRAVIGFEFGSAEKPERELIIL